MKANYALAYRMGSETEWNYHDDEYWLGPDEKYHEDTRQEIIDHALNAGETVVHFRHELWINDESLGELKGEDERWCLDWVDEKQGYSFDTAAEALIALAEETPTVDNVEVSRVVRHTIREEEVPVEGWRDTDDREAEKPKVEVTKEQLEELVRMVRSIGVKPSHKVLNKFWREVGGE